MTDSRNPPNEDAADQALRTGLSAPRLTPEAMRRIRAATEAEWRATVRAQAPVRRAAAKWSMAAAASVLVLIGAAYGVWNYNDRSAAGASFGRVARAESPGLALKQILRADRPVPERAELRVPAALEARGDTLVALAAGGNLRAARGSTFELADASTVRLRHGELYIDIPPGARRAAPLVVETPAGQFRHLGTQFSVAILGAQTRLRVREGAVLWQAAGGESKVDAGTEVLMDTREVSRRSISTTGREWSWVESLAPEIDIENRPLQEFLAWFARETGRRLELADEAARSQVQTILMHGNVRGLTAMEALSAVMAATTLRYELPEGAIRVSSARESTPNH